MLRQELDRNWKMHRTDEKTMIRAQVPGTVYGDLLREGEMEDPFWKDNEEKALKLMDYDYEYVDTFACDKELLKMDRVLLRFDGLDTIADITLNGKKLGSVSNMHQYYEYEVKKILKEKGNELKVYFHSPVKYITAAYEKAPTRGTEDAMNGFVHLRKAHCMFGWDWGAHLPDAGIFRPVYLLGIDRARIENVEILQKHKKNGKAIDVTLTLTPEIDLDETRKSAEWMKEMSVTYTLTDPSGKEKVYKDSPETIEVKNAKLWWPNGYGEQNLYTLKADLYIGDTLVDSIEKRIGLRTLTVNRKKDKWGENFAAEVNGICIFSMGADYIPEDHLLGRVTPETTRSLLEKAVFANHNCIRVWGGGYYPSDWFYDICDELGLLVWQDFMFACGVYDLTPEFEKSITREFEQNIKRIRHHASLSILCGNNEMESFVDQGVWVSKPAEVRDYIIMYERILPRMVEKYAPQVFYWPSSPSSGGSFDNPGDEHRGDVHYWEVWHGNKPFTEYRKYRFRYLSEFGFQSFPSRKTIETFTDDPRDMNIFSYIMEKHQRNGQANGKIMGYMQQTYQYPSDFDTVLYASQLLQADGIRYGVEHFRRHRGECMGAVVWQLNDCWPVASWSSVDYCGRLKALHYYEKRFFAPLMISCEEHGMVDCGIELNRKPFDFEKSIRLNVANETLKDEHLTVKWQLRDPSAKILEQHSEKVTVPALTSVWLDKVELPQADLYENYVSYQLYKGTQVVSEGSVNFSFPKYFRYQDPKLKVTVKGDEITVSAKAYAKSVEILNENEDLILSDNYFDLNGDSKTVKILSGDPKKLRVRSVYDIH
ncbi:MAG: glycoside hydrolase family 2 protein [Lachnospiraceae bacterium]|nr:glycoside hydrolase family 2 protein [Lachnospiraceae bacterium]